MISLNSEVKPAYVDVERKSIIEFFNMLSSGPIDQVIKTISDHKSWDVYRNPNGFSPFTFAMKLENIEVVRALLQTRSDPFQQDNNGMTMADIAVTLPHQFIDEIARIIPPDILNGRNQTGETLLERAIRYGNKAAVIELLEHPMIELEECADSLEDLWQLVQDNFTQEEAAEIKKLLDHVNSPAETNELDDSNPWLGNFPMLEPLDDIICNREAKNLIDMFPNFIGERNECVMEVVNRPEWAVKLFLDEKKCKISGEKIIDMEGNGFTGIAPHLRTGESSFYIAGYIQPTVPEPTELVIKQGQVGDCYALSILYGLLCHQFFTDEIRNKFEIRSDGSLSFTLTPSDRSALTAINDPFIIRYMEKEGYTIMDSSTGIDVSISKEKVEAILSDSKRAYSNSLFVLVMEHFLGNMVRDTKTVSRNWVLEKSILIHQNGRQKNSQAIVANLFGHRSCRTNFYKNNAFTKDALAGKLRQYKSDERCTDDIKKIPGSDKGPVYVSYLYNGIDRHSHVLNDVYFDEESSVSRISLINPHDTSSPVEVDLETLMTRSPSICEINRK